MSAKDIGKKAKLGVFYNTIAKLIATFGQFFSVIILARLLHPEEYGIVTAGMLVIGAVTKFGEFGFHNGLVQRKEKVTEKHINTLFLMDFGFKIIIWVAVYFSSAWFASFLNVPELTTALPILSAFMLLECFATTPKAVLRRKMDFKSTSIINTTDKYVSIVSSITLAYLGFGYWSLIYCKILSQFVAAVMAIHKTKWFPKPVFDFKACKDLFHFGVMVSVRNLFKYGSDKIDRFFITKFLGPGPVAIYEKAFELMRMPQKEITRSVNRVVFSAFSRIQDEPERIRRAFRKLLLTVSLLSFPMLFGMAYVAPQFVPLVLGDKWIGMVFPLQIMCVAGILRSTDPFLNSLLTATGFVKSTVSRRAIEFALIAVATWFGVKHGIEGVAVAITGAALVVTFLMVQIITKVTNIGWADYLGPQAPALLTSALMLAIIHIFTFSMNGVLDPAGFAMLILQCVVGMLSYVGLHFIFRFKIVTELIEELMGDSKSGLAKIRSKLGFGKKKASVA